MFLFTAMIICDKCGTAIKIDAKTKAELFSMGELRGAAKRRGWKADNKQALCEYCKNNAKRPEHYRG